MSNGLHVQYPLFSRQIFEKYSNIKYYEHLFSEGVKPNKT